MTQSSPDIEQAWECHRAKRFDGAYGTYPIDAYVDFCAGYEAARATQLAAPAEEAVYKALNEAREELCKTTHHLTLGYKLDGFDYAVEAVETVLLAPSAMAQSDEGKSHEATYLRGWNEGIERAAELLDDEGSGTPAEKIRTLIDTTTTQSEAGK